MSGGWDDRRRGMDAGGHENAVPPPVLRARGVLVLRSLVDVRMGMTCPDDVPGTGFSVAVFPGGALIALVLAVNIVTAQAKRIELSWRKSGLRRPGRVAEGGRTRRVERVPARQNRDRAREPPARGLRAPRAAPGRAGPPPVLPTRIAIRIGPAMTTTMTTTKQAGEP